MQATDPDVANAVYIFWGIIVLFVLCWLALHKSGMTQAVASPNSSFSAPSAEAMTTVSYRGPYVNRMWLKPPKEVAFDPSNHVHLIALAMLHIQFEADGRPVRNRQHPTLRFEFDPSVHDNAYQAMLETFVLHSLPAQVKESARKLVTQETGNKVLSIKKEVRVAKAG